MIEHLPKKKFWELYNKLPVELQDALFSEEMGDNVIEICERYGALSSLDFVMDGVTDVMLGVLPPNEFLDSLEKNLKLDAAAARKMAHELNRFVFFPVKAPLEQIYNLQMTPIAGTGAPKKPLSKSAYQEPI